MGKHHPQSGSEPGEGVTPPAPGGRQRRGQPIGYQIRIKGHFEDRWADSYEGLVVTLAESGDTLLTVPVADQAVLYGLLRKLRDRGVPLISINPVGSALSGNTSKEECR
jgi:hypothetical protein